MTAAGRPASAVRAGAFTVVELLIALVLSGLVSLGVAMMLASVAAGTQSHNDIRRASTTRQVAVHRFGALTRDAARILATDSEHFVLWTGDKQDTGQPNLSELRRLEWDPEMGDVWAYEADGDLAEDPAYDPEDNFSTITQQRIESGDLTGTLMLTDVTDWKLTLEDEADGEPVRLLRLRLTVDHPSGPDTATIISALRLTPEFDDVEE